MKKIGLVNIDTSHPLSFADKMANHPEWDMQYTKIFNDGFRGPDEVNWFKKIQYGTACNQRKRAGREYRYWIYSGL